jgi:beta-glucosidase
MLYTRFFAALGVLGITFTFAVSSALAADVRDPEIESLISRLTLNEKVRLVTGDDPQTRAIKRLGIPSIVVSDGPLGVRSGHSTAFPAGLALGATFHPELANQMGLAIADEARLKNINMMLGPCVNIARTPFGGRNFESYGEDPFLNSILAASYITGMQSHGVIATVKHFAANDQETERKSVSANVDIRTLFEIHLPMFKAAVDAGSLSLMSAYNRINGVYASENKFLIHDVLKSMWGFKGFVVSDWTSTHSTVAAAKAGLDLEMPSAIIYGAKLTHAVTSGKVPMSDLDDKVRRLLYAMKQVGLIGQKKSFATPIGPETKEHQALAQQIAEQGIVLLKNEGLLPLANTESIAVIGPHARNVRSGGGGSSRVTPFHTVSPFEGIKNEFPNSHVQLADGVLISGDLGQKITANDVIGSIRAEYFRTADLKGKPFAVRTEPAIELSQDPKLDDRFGVRLKARIKAPVSGVYTFSAANSHSTRVLLNNKELIKVPVSSDGGLSEKTVALKRGQVFELTVESSRGDDDTETNLQVGWRLPNPNQFREAVELARTSNVAILFLGSGNDMEGEGADRESLALPDDQLELVNAVMNVNKNTVVVLSGGGMFLMPWLVKVRAVLHSWYPGQEGGRAIAEILSGAVNPSGKLPVSFLKSFEDSSAYGRFPGKNGNVNYTEGVFVGYRYLDQTKREPAFPFGFGLSYTTFEVANLNVSGSNEDGVTLTVDVKNSGHRAGAEVVQAYVGETNPTVPRPPRELKAFARVDLEPGQTKMVELKLSKSAFAFFDVPSMSWKVNAGDFRINVGTSSRSLPLSTVVHRERSLLKN